MWAFQGVRVQCRLLRGVPDLCEVSGSIPVQCGLSGASLSCAGSPGHPCLVQAVPGTVAGTQLPVVQQVVILQEPAQDEQEFVEADLVVLVLVCSPEQL